MSNRKYMRLRFNTIFLGANQTDTYPIKNKVVKVDRAFRYVKFSRWANNPPKLTDETKHVYWLTFYTHKPYTTPYKGVYESAAATINDNARYLIVRDHTDTQYSHWYVALPPGYSGLYEITEDGMLFRVKPRNAKETNRKSSKNRKAE